MIEVPETHYARNGAVSIAYQVTGQGPPDLLFSFGHAGQLDLMWELPAIERFLQRLASFSRLILYDRRGMGLSDRGIERFSFEDRVGDLKAVLDAVGAETAAHFSCCTAGRTSIYMAATYPQLTPALVLFDSHPATLRDDDYLYGAASDVNESVAATIATSWGEDSYQRERFSNMAPSAAGDPQSRRWWTKMNRAAASPAEMAHMIRTLREIDVRYVLPTVRVPTLILHRADDREADIGAGRYMADRIVGATFVELPGGDHLPMFGETDQLLDEVEVFLTGIRRQHAPERVLATVLFTDIVASTSSASSLGDRRWRDVLDRHNRSVRAQLARYGGEEVKTTGDGFLAIFDSPTRAIQCARLIVDEAEELGLQLRAGIHTGECERMDGDVAGIAVHIAARVSALAEPGQLFVSRTVQDLVAGSGIAFDERGEHVLKGVPGAWKLFAVRD